jgi:hypothetical protein
MTIITELEFNLVNIKFSYNKNIPEIALFNNV